MDKKDFWTLMVFNTVFVVLLIEYFCGLSFALELMIAWAIISLLVDVRILFKYIKIKK